ncbi:MAG: porin family protein [Endomicrobium sp.]|jgi:hypothetical protein|nr:porin family protein [Endomicrobium sp.]
MKKLLASILCTIFAVSSSFALTIIPRVGFDIPSTMNNEKEPDQETKLGFVIGVEARGEISNYFGWGAGAEYLVPRGFVNDSDDNDFSFLPVYASLRFYPLGAWDKVRPYIKVNAGYSVIASSQGDEDMKGGVYTAIGLGTQYQKFIVEVMASIYDGEYDDIGISYQKIGITLGYKFNISFSKQTSEE